MKTVHNREELECRLNFATEDGPATDLESYPVSVFSRYRGQLNQLPMDLCTQFISQMIWQHIYINMLRK
jgi:hypothetical protein